MAGILWQEVLLKPPATSECRGDLPSHPALLDWLAVDFREHNWDIKRLVKMMVTSATYRQSAVVNPENWQKIQKISTWHMVHATGFMQNL